MSFNLNYKTLIGNDVRLEPININHTEGLFRAGSELEDWKYLPTAGFASFEDAQSWVQASLNFLSQKLHYTYVIIHNNTNTVIGSTRYLNIRERDRGLEVGYSWLAHNHLRTAANTESKLLIIGNAFEICGAIRVELKTDARNIRSQNAIERIGGKKEAVLRKHMIVQHGFIRDSVLYSITDEEWPTIKQSLNEKLQKYV